MYHYTNNASKKGKTQQTHYQLALQNLTCFTSENEDGGVYYPPELFIEIKDNKLFIKYLHGRYGWWGYTFRLNKQQNDFNLIGYDYSNNFGPIQKRITSINFLTQKMQLLTNKDIHADLAEEEQSFYEEWFSVPKKPIYRLSAIKDFEEFDLPIVYSNMDKSKYNDLW